MFRFIALVAVAAVAIVGCTKHDAPWRHDGDHTVDPGGQGGQGGNQQGGGSGQDFQLQEKGWYVGYAGRDTYEGQRVEVVWVRDVPTGTSYLVSVISRDNFSSYEGDLKAFFRDELKNAGDYIYTGNSSTVLFDPFRHGTWYAFVIGLDKNLELSGEYSYCKFTVEEEQPTDEYSRWLGNWKVGKGNVTYDITVSQEEANFVYRIDGWEAGCITETGTVMDQEYLEAFFDDGYLYFTSQYIQTYEEEYLGTLDELFLGQIDYDGIHHAQGLYIIQDEGIDLARAFFDARGQVVFEPCRVVADIDGETFDTYFYNMQYFCTDGKMWYHYNDNVPAFPLTMTRGGAGAGARALSARGVQTKAGGTVSSSKALRGTHFVPRGQKVATTVKVQ